MSLKESAMCALDTYTSARAAIKTCYVQAMCRNKSD